MHQHGFSASVEVHVDYAFNIEREKREDSMRERRENVCNNEHGVNAFVKVYLDCVFIIIIIIIAACILMKKYLTSSRVSCNRTVMHSYNHAEISSYVVSFMTSTVSNLSNVSNEQCICQGLP